MVVTHTGAAQPLDLCYGGTTKHNSKLEIRMRSRVHRAANVYVLRTRLHLVSRHFRSVSAAGMYR